MRLTALRVTVLAACLSVALVATLAARSPASRPPHRDAAAEIQRLPHEDWVYEHWFPFKEPTLWKLVGIDRNGIRAWLGPKNHTLAQLGRQHGLNLRQLTRTLIAPWRGHAPRNRYRMFGARTRLLMTNNFVSRHMFGHLFHTRTLNRALPVILGEPMPEVIADYAKGASWVEIGMRHGRPPDSTRRRLLAILRAGNREGVRRDETFPRQARLQYSFQKAELWRFATRGRSPDAHMH